MRRNYYEGPHIGGNKGCDPSSDINENKALIKILGKEMISYVILL